MKLKNVILTDGRIVSYDFNDTNLVINFEDYSNNLLVLIFFDVSDLMDNECTTYEVMDRKIAKSKECNSMQFLDDDSEVLLSFKYKNVEVTFKE